MISLVLGRGGEEMNIEARRPILDGSQGCVTEAVRDERGAGAGVQTPGSQTCNFLWGLGHFIPPDPHDLICEVAGGIRSSVRSFIAVF